MDLEEYRRAYMQAEGFGNTPANFVKRISDFANNVSSIPDAINRDRIEHKARKKARGKAREDMKENGVSVFKSLSGCVNIFDCISNVIYIHDVPSYSLKSNTAVYQ